MRRSNLRISVAGVALSLVAGFGATGFVSAQDTEAGNINRDRQAERERRRDEADLDRHDRFRVYRGDNYFSTDGRGADLLRNAIVEGYRQGRGEGAADNTARRRSDWGRSDIYRDGNYGYQDLVDRGQYKYYFRQGFELGYQDGFNGRSDYGYNDAGKFKVMVSAVNKLLTVVSY